MAIEGYVTVEAAALNSRDRNWISGGDPIPPDGQDDGRYALFWRYDPDASQNGITGISWFGSHGGPYTGEDSSINAQLKSDLDTLYSGNLELLKQAIDEVFSSWSTRAILMTYIQDAGLLDTLSTAGCFSW